MANFLDRFNQTVVGSNGKYADYISTIAPSGDFKRINDLPVILNSWNNLLLTPTRTYLFDPEYGSDLFRLIFDPADEATVEKIKEEVVNRIRLYDNRASITGVEVKFLQNMKGFNLTIEVNYKGSTSELKTSLDEETYFKFFEIPASETL